MCPNVTNIDLTDEIKNTILNHRIYHVPEPIQIPTKITTNITNIVNMGTYAIDQVMMKLEKDMPNFLDTKFFKKRRHNLLLHKNNENSEHWCPSIPDFLEFIMEFLENERYNQAFTLFIRTHMLHLHDDDVWQTRPIHTGMKNVLSLLKVLILDAYEISLTRQLKHWKTRKEALGYLKEYYEFIQCFDIKATFLEERRNDNLLLYNKNEIEYDNEEYSGYIYIEQLEKLWTETTFANKDYKKQKITSQVKQIVSYHSDETFKALQGLMNIDN